MADRTYRQCTSAEIGVLQQAGCYAESWEQVWVMDPFVPERLRDVMFEGVVRLGRMDGVVRCRDGAERLPCITRTLLRNVTIGDNCLITNVPAGLSNVEVGSHVEIENVGRIASTGESTFGNGHKIAVLNEGGGRHLRITTQTSAQVAYLTVFYRHNAALVKALDLIASRYAAAQRREQALIGSHSCIANCGEIVDVRIGEWAVVNGAARLREGTVDSSVEAPTFIGTGVIAEDFIVQRGASLRDGAILSSSLLGEAAQAGKQCSIENSVLFANSECFHSELSCVFGGPYTVTHHRSTLLIAAYTSFFNAGSGTNQSNHMYKLGPLHQGILERGCKTGSGSYLLWPCRVGAFSVVIGKHYANVDTSLFPFSYLNEENGKTVLVPAMNLFTVGTTRDAAKWPARDRRKSVQPLDCVVFPVLSPYTAQKMSAGRAALLELHERSSRDREYVVYRGVYIKRLLLKTCARYYGLALQKYYGDVLMARLQSEPEAPVRTLLTPIADAQPGDQNWIDLCGLLCPVGRVDALVEDIVNGRIMSYDELHAAFGRICDAYEADEWNWFLAAYRKEYGRELAKEDRETIRRFVDDWADASQKLLHMVLQDAGKEFDENAKIGFGIDGRTEADFEAVRGTYDTNAFVTQIHQQIESIATQRERALVRI